MKYVQRDVGGGVIGVYTNPQKQEDGSSLTHPEPLADDHPDVVRFEAIGVERDTRARIDRGRDLALLHGVPWNGRTWHTDATFQCQITSIVSAFVAGILPADATVKIRAKDNSINELTYPQCKALAATVLIRVQAVWAESWAAKDALG